MATLPPIRPQPTLTNAGTLTASDDSRYLFATGSTETRSPSFRAFTLTVDVTRSLAAGNWRGLTWDGTNLWAHDFNGNGGLGTIHKIDPATGSSLMSFNTPSDDTADLTWDGTNLWVANRLTNTVFKVNPANGAILSQFTASDMAIIDGIAWDFETSTIWCAESLESAKRRDPTTGNLLETNFAVDGYWYLELINGELLRTETEPAAQVLRYPKSSAATTGIGTGNTYIPGSGADFARGMAWDGSGLWIIANNTLTRHIYAEVVQHPVPADFGSMDTLSWKSEHRRSVAGDDTIQYSFRIMSKGNASVLAAASSSGGPYVVVASNVTSATDVVVGPTAFPYVNTTATKEEWDSAIVQIAQTYTVSMGSDNARLEIDHLEFTGTYTASAAPTAPSAPTGLSGSHSFGMIDLSWTASTDTTTPQASLVYEIGRSSTQNGTYTVLSTTAAGVTSFSESSPGPGTWWYRVRAYDGALWGEYATTSVTVAAVVLGAPDLEVSDLTMDSVTLTANLVTFENVDSYEFQRNGVTLQNTASNVLNDSGLSPGTAYTYRVRGYNSTTAGTWSADTIVTTLAYEWVFRLTVTDDDGITHSVLVSVPIEEAPPENLLPWLGSGMVRPWVGSGADSWKGVVRT